MPLSPPSKTKLLRRLRRLGATFAVALAFFAVLSFDWRPEERERAPRLIFAGSREGPLLAGAGKAEVRLPEDLPLAGYRPFGRKAERQGAPLYARSLLLQVGELRTAIVAVELMTVSDSLAGRLGGLLELEGADCGIIAATHTHSGPGGYDRDLVPQAVAIGRFDPAVEEAIAHAVASSLAAARADLGPAELSIAEGRPDLNHSRDLRGAPVDDLLTRLLLQRQDGSRVGQLLRFAAHPTLNPRGVGPHGDWPGIVMERLEEEGGVALVLQGAVGDARARERERQTSTDTEAADLSAPDSPADPSRSASFAALVVEASRALSPGAAASSLPLACAEAEFDLPRASLHSVVPWPLGPAVSNLASFAAGDTARTVALRLDDLILLGVPAEPTFAAAEGAEGRIEAWGLRGRTVSLAQGYAGYAPTPEEVEARRFSAKAAWYGGELSERLAAGKREAIDALLRAHPQPKRLE